MKKILATIAIAVCSLAVNAQDWKDISLMEKVTVSMPGTPVEDKSKGLPLQKVTLDDGSEVMAGTMDFSLFGMDEEMLKKMSGTEEFKQQMEAGIGAQPGTKLIKNDIIKYADKYVGYEMVLEVEKDGKTSTVYSRMIFYKSNGINVSYKAGAKADMAMRDKFFSSLKIAE